MLHMKTSKAGVDLIKSFEGLFLKAYVCPAGKLTIGWGCTEGVHEGMEITEQQAQLMLEAELSKFEKAVGSLVRVPLTHGQFDALVSFSYNVGVAALEKSTLLRKLNSGDYASVPDELARWVHGGGKVLPGLVKRRRKEGELWRASTHNVPAAIPTPPTPKTASTEAAKEPDAMSDLQKFLPLFDQFAPVLGGMIFGAPGAKLAPLAVAGIHALADALDGEEPTPAAVAQKLSTMPSEAVPEALQAAESAVKGSLPKAALPAPVTPPAPAQGLYVDPTNSLIKLGVAALAAMFATKFGFDAVTVQHAFDALVPVAQGLAALAMSGLSGWSLWRSISGSNANTAAVLKS